MKKYLRSKFFRFARGVKAFFQPNSIIILLSFTLGTYFNAGRLLITILLISIFYIRRSGILLMIIFFILGILYAGTFYNLKFTADFTPANETKSFLQNVIQKNITNPGKDLINAILFRDKNYDLTLSGVKASGVNFIIINSIVLSFNKYLNKKLLLIFSIIISLYYFFLIGYDEIVIFKATFLLLIENLALFSGRTLNTKVSVTLVLFLTTLFYPLALTQSFVQFSFLMTLLIFFLIRILPGESMRLYLAINLSYIICIIIFGDQITSNSLILSSVLLVLSPLLLISSLLFISISILRIEFIVKAIADLLNFFILKLNNLNEAIPSILIKKELIASSLLILVIFLIYKDYENFKLKKYNL